MGNSINEHERIVVSFGLKDLEKICGPLEYSLLKYAMDLAKGEGSIDFFLLVYDERHGRKKRNVLKWYEEH